MAFLEGRRSKGKAASAEGGGRRAEGGGWLLCEARSVVREFGEVGPSCVSAGGGGGCNGLVDAGQRRTP
ncbi:MAG: hypothetical protein RI897_2367 [Verrucomicrobiota bacterium]